jgi:hypothetical protein
VTYPTLAGGQTWQGLGSEVAYPDRMSLREAFLPGEELIRKGTSDLEQGVESVEALLVSIGAPRLSRLGVEVHQPIAHPEHRLYELLAADEPDAAHSRYNALLRRLVSFERAAECAS